MNENSQKYFTTGQLASLYGINKRTLMYYDSIDLFKPAIIKDNGYRYYSYQQTSLLDVILTFKEIGMPLSEIKQNLVNRTPEKLLNLLYQQKDVLINQIAELQHIKKIVDNKIDLIKKNKDIDYNQIYLEEVEEEYLSLSEYIGNISEDEALKVMYKHIDICYKNKLNNGLPLGGMILTQRLIKKENLFYDYSFMKLDSKVCCSETWIKPKGIYIIAYFKGSWSIVPKNYSHIFKFIEQNDIKITGYVYEEGIIDEAAVDNFDNLVFKVSIPII